MNRYLACLLALLPFASPAVAMLRLDNNRPPAAARPQAEELHPTSWIVRRSREVIAGTPAARSLFLTTSFYAPHPPLFPPARLFEKFLRARLPPAAMGAWVERASLKPAGDKSGARILLEGEALRRGAVSMQPVGLEDVMPTVLDLAGVRRPASVDGRSLVAVLRGAAAPVREWLHYEHAPIYSPEQGFHALTDGRHKYIWRPKSGREQVFDLATDPHEEHDLAVQPGQQELLERWRGRLVRRLAGRPEGFSDGQKLITGRAYPALQKAPQPKP